MAELIDDLKNERKDLYEVVLRQKEAINLLKKDRFDKNDEIDTLILKRQDVNMEMKNKKIELERIQEQYRLIRDKI